MTKFTTEQEEFWAGAFGDDYSDRNAGNQLVASNVALFARILEAVRTPTSVMEFGANVGLNLLALRQLLPEAELSAVEINRRAVERLEGIEGLKVYPKSILDFEPDYQRDLVFTKGVLIHIAPDQLDNVYALLHATSRRFVLVAEYYNPSPVEVTYRGHDGRLFKRDFAGDMLDRYPDLALKASGFAYHRAAFPQDDLTWFLLEKQSDG